MNIEEVLQRMAETDEPAAKASADAKRLERHLKIVFASEYLRQDGGTVAEKEARVRTSESYKAAHELLCEAEATHLLHQNERSTNTMRFEYWRSQNANRRQAGGNM